MPKPKNDFFESVPTPNPSEMAFRVREDAAFVFPSQFPQRGDKFKDCKILSVKSRVAQQDLASYEYTYFSKEGETLWFYFVKPKTEEEKNTPFRITRSFGNHSWPPILKALVLIADSSFPRSTNVGGANGQQGIVTGPSYYVREIYIPEANEGSLFQLEEFFAPTPFKIPQHEVPQPSSVSYDVPGRSGTFPRCLHKKLIVPNARTGTEKVIGDTTGDAAGIVSGQVFPATNFTEWDAYVISDKETFDVGYYRQKITVYPPDEPQTVANN